MAANHVVITDLRNETLPVTRGRVFRLFSEVQECILMMLPKTDILL
jgi:hypothetical protein